MNIHEHQAKKILQKYGAVVPEGIYALSVEELIEKVIQNNADKVAEYKSGKDKLFGFFVGQAMKESKGKGNPQLINKILKEKLNG